MAALKESLLNNQHRIDNSKEELSTILADFADNGTIIEFDDTKDYYFNRMVVVKGDKSKYWEAGSEYVNTGMFQDSVHIGVDENHNSLFRFLPFEGNRLCFYEWSYESEPVFIRNNGKEPLEADTPYGKFLIPVGECYPVDGTSSIGKIKESISPAIDRHSVWESYVDAKGQVNYKGPK